MSSKISALTALASPATGDLLALVDISDTTQAASGSTRKVTLANISALVLNGLSINATTGVFILANGKLLTVNNTLTFSGTDSTTMTFPSSSASIARTDAANTFTGISTATSWVLTTPTITTKVSPTTDDGAPLGDTTHNFSDLFLATGAVINFANSNLTITHSSGLLTLTGALTIPTLTVSTTANIGPLVDSVDGTTPLNNINQVVASGTVYTLTTSYAALDFGTTDPVLTITNAGTYAIYVEVQTSLVGTTATTQTVSFKLRRTNNTAADLSGSTFGVHLPAATAETGLGPSISIGPIKYTTTNTDDSITVQGILSASLGAGSVTASSCTITAIRMY